MLCTILLTSRLLKNEDNIPFYSFYSSPMQFHKTVSALKDEVHLNNENIHVVDLFLLFLIICVLFEGDVESSNNLFIT